MSKILFILLCKYSYKMVSKNNNEKHEKTKVGRRKRVVLNFFSPPGDATPRLRTALCHWVKVKKHKKGNMWCWR